MPQYVNLLEGGAAVAGVLVTFALFWCVGHLVPARQSWEYPVIGWGIVYLLSIVAALCGLTDLRIVLGMVCALALVVLLWRRPTLQWHGVAFWLAAVPLLVLSALSPPIFTDSFSHWLPNSAYLYQMDRFLEAPLEKFFSLHPTYPTALPLAVYTSSVVAGRFVELAGNVINVLMFLLAMSCAARLMRECWPSQAVALDNSKVTGIFAAAIAFCMTVLNPAIELEYYWSTIADPAQAVLVFLMIVECCRHMTRDTAENRSSSLSALFVMSCVMAGLKSNAWPLAVILGGTAMFLGFVHRIPARRWWPPALAIVGGTIFATFLWKIYLRGNLDIPDQFALRPLRDWSFPLADELLIAKLLILRTHTLYSAMVLATMAVGVTTLIRRSFIAHPTLRLLLGFVTVAMALHVASLFAAYLGTGFDDFMITTASSFPRYTTQVGYAVCAAGLGVLALAVMRRLPAQRISALTAAGVCIGVCEVLFLARTGMQTPKLEQLVDERTEQRRLALTALREVPPDSRVASVAAKWTINYLRYVAWVDLPPERRSTNVADLMLFKSDNDCQAQDTVNGWLADPGIDVVLLIDAGELAGRCMGNPAADQIWQRSTGQWRALNLGR